MPGGIRKQNLITEGLFRPQNKCIMKELELSTALISMGDCFCTYGGWAQSESILHEDDFETGLGDAHPDYYFMYFDNEKYMKEISDRTHSFLEDFLSDLLNDLFDVDIEYIADGYNCPREYNVRGDRYDFVIRAETFKPLLDYCLNHKDFNQFLNDTYSSRDGFISFTANNLDELLEDIENDDMTAWGAVLSFIINAEANEDALFYAVHEALSQDMHYSEFVDYTELKKFLKEMKEGEPEATELWQEALLNRKQL